MNYFNKFSPIHLKIWNARVATFSSTAPFKMLDDERQT